MTQSVYDDDTFFSLYQKLRTNPRSVNELIEKPTLYGLLPDLQGKKVLDLACGAGSHLAYYWQLGASAVVGVDLSQNMLHSAEQTLKALGANFALYHSDICHLPPIASAPFDVVTSSFAFHYIADFDALLTEIKQILQPGGELIFSQEHPIVTAHLQGARWQKDDNGKPLAYRLNHYGEEGIRARNWFQKPFTTYHRTMASILNRLIQQGFEILAVAEPCINSHPDLVQEFADITHRPVLLFVKVRLRAK